MPLILERVKQRSGDAVRGVSIPGCYSPSSTSGLGGAVGVADAFSVREGSSTCRVGSPTASCASGGLPEERLLFSPSTAKGLVAGTGSAGFPEVDGGAVARLGSVEEVGFEKNIFFFFDDKGVTHSRVAGLFEMRGIEVS